MILLATTRSLLQPDLMHFRWFIWWVKKYEINVNTLAETKSMRAVRNVESFMQNRIVHYGCNSTDWHWTCCILDTELGNVHAENRFVVNDHAIKPIIFLRAMHWRAEVGIIQGKGKKSALYLDINFHSFKCIHVACFAVGCSIMRSITRFPYLSWLL